MLAKTILLPALALAGAVAASPQDSQPTLCAQPTATITNAADASQLAQCTSVSGTIVLSPDAAGSIDISGPKEIQGDFIAHSAGNLVGLTSSTIQSIGGSFDLFNLTTLSTLAFSKLTSSNTIIWNALPALGQLTLTDFISQASSVTIENTGLTTLDGINLDTVDTMDINNNRRLTTISTQVGSVGTLLNIASNGLALSVDLPNLIWASNATFRNASTISIPSLSVINGTLTFDENTLSSLSAPNLTSIGDAKHGIGSFTFVGNPGVQNLTFPALTSIAGANEIANNTALTTISFPALTYVGGAIDFSGNFTTPNLNALKTVKGGFSLESTATIDCSKFKAESGASSTLQGSFNCESATDNPQPNISGTSTGSSSSASATSSKGAAVSYGINEAVAGLSVIGGILQILL